jgi:hypothetical protein
MGVGQLHASVALPQWKRSTGTHWIGGWVCPTPGFVLPGTETSFPGCPVCSLVAIPIQLTWLQLLNFVYTKYTSDN